MKTQEGAVMLAFSGVWTGFSWAAERGPLRDIKFPRVPQQPMVPKKVNKM